MQDGGLRVGGAPLGSHESGRQCEEHDDRDNGEQQRRASAAASAGGGRPGSPGPGRTGSAMRDHLQDGDGLRVQRTRPGQRGWTAAEHQRRAVRAAAARQRGAAAGRRREGRRPQGRPYSGSVSRGNIFADPSFLIQPFSFSFSPSQMILHPSSQEPPCQEPRSSPRSANAFPMRLMQSYAGCAPKITSAIRIIGRRTREGTRFGLDAISQRTSKNDRRQAGGSMNSRGAVINEGSIEYIEEKHTENVD